MNISMQEPVFACKPVLNSQTATPTAHPLMNAAVIPHSHPGSAPDASECWEFQASLT